MSSEPVIDLCESSEDEEVPIIERTVKKAASAKPISANNNLAADSKPSAITAASTKLTGYLWESSDEDEPLPPARKDRQRRRESKLVTPEDNLKNSSLEIDDEDSTSDEGDYSSSRVPHRTKRKQPRTLFSKSSKPGRAIGTTPKGKSMKNSPLEESSDDSSSDESVPYSTVFSKKVAVPKSNPNTSNASGKDPVVMLDSSDEEDEKVPAGKLSDGKTTWNTTGGLSSSLDVSLVNPYSKQRDNSRPNASSSSGSRTQAESSLTVRQILQYPRVGPNTGRQYDDIRAKCLLALWKYSRTLVSASYNLTKLDSYCRRIKDLALSTEFPIRSFTEYAGSGYSIESTALREALQAGGMDRIKTTHSRDAREEGYYSIAEAALVSMLEHIEASARSRKIDVNDETNVASLCSDKDQWVFLSSLIPEIDKRLNKAITPARLGRDDEDHGEAFYTNPTTRSAEYKQLDQLTKVDAKSEMPLLKAHQKNKRLCFELTLRGLRKAWYVRNRRFPEPPGYMRTSKLYSDSVEPCFDGVCLVVDNREGGGASKKLHSMCQELDMRKVPYIVAKLDIGDYAFVSTDTQKLLPIVIERKSIQDVAQSIWDGRWTSQKQRMYQGQYVFGFDNCRLAYLIEGKADGQELTGGAMGQTQFNVSREQLDTEIGNLQEEGFEVLTTNNVKGSMAKLVQLTRSVADDYRNGKLSAKFTFEEFMKRVHAIPRGVDFSRIAKDHQTRRTSDNGESLVTKEAISEKSNRTNPSDIENRHCDESVAAAAAAAVKKNEPISDHRYNSWKVLQLKEECEKYGLPKTGKKSELVARLLGPRPPEAWLQRKKANLYVPARYDTCGSAILVSIWFHQRQQSSVDTWKGLEKEDIITLAESLNISKDPFTGTGKGLFNYDGWSCMGPLREGQSPLIWREKGGFFKLTTMGGDLSGFQVAEALHDWCHAHQKCRCKELGLR